VADEVSTVFSDYVLPFDAGAADQYALIVSRCDGIDRPIEGFDAQIAAICQTHDATLATRNMKDFWGGWDRSDRPLVSPDNARRIAMRRDVVARQGFVLVV
jgi:hypothetical protein